LDLWEVSTWSLASFIDEDSGPGDLIRQSEAPNPHPRAMATVSMSNSVRQVTQGVGHGCHESIDDANYDGDLATYMRK
jgi:hypothetical protein